MTEWRVEPKYGPDSDDAKYAFVFDERGSFVGNLKYAHASRIVGTMNSALPAKRSEIAGELRKYAEYRATPDDLSRLLWRAADLMEGAKE